MNAVERYKNKLLKERQEYLTHKQIALSSIKRGLGFNLIKENIIDEKVAYHHIDNINVIAIPFDLHQLYINPDKKIHRFMCYQIIKQIYGKIPRNI